MVCHYIFTCGTAEKWLYARSDTHARRVTSRWIRLYWERFRAATRPGSMADAINNAWHEPVRVELHRAHVDSAGIIAATHARIDGWDLDCNAEIARHYARRSKRRKAPADGRIAEVWELLAGNGIKRTADAKAIVREIVTAAPRSEDLHCLAGYALNRCLEHQAMTQVDDG